MYVHQPVSVVVVPPQRLVGFARVTLTPGQTKTVHVALPASALAVTPSDTKVLPRPQVELGATGADRHPGHPHRGLHHPQLTPQKGH